MRFHPPSRRVVLVAAAGLLALAAVPVVDAATSAKSGTTARAVSAALPVTGAAATRPDPSAVASKLARQLGSRSAGAYLDRSTRKLVVTVTNASDARTVQDAGATPRTVTRSGARLAQTKKKLDDAAVPGTARMIDPATDQVVVSVDSTVTGTRMAKVRKAVGDAGGAARMRQAQGTFRPLIGGGDAIWGSGYRCSLGFNVHDASGGAFFITAGHCGNVVSTWFADQGQSQQLATTQDSRFPGTDYSIAAYSGSAAHPSEVDLHNGSTQPITGAADATAGESVQRSGSTTGVHGGTVLAVNASVTYPEGTVNGLIDTNVCAEPGDSGGALFDGGTALGLTSGGSGDCSGGGETFFQPVPPVLSAYGVSIG